jgi:hypothetical protein
VLKARRQWDDRWNVRRQLFLRIDDNYFSLSTTITFDPAGRSAAAKPLRTVPASPPKTARAFFHKIVFPPCCRRLSGRWESGNPGLGFPLFHGPHFPILFFLAVLFQTCGNRRSCGNVGISPAFGEISKGLVERVGSLPLAFHAVHSPVISTALFLGGFWF